MKAYFGINNEIYQDDKTVVLVFLNKMSKGRGSTFMEGWYLKLINEAIPEMEKTFKKLCKAFEETFIPKDKGLSPPNCLLPKHGPIQQ